MPSTAVTVGSSVGLHARPATIIAKAAVASGAKVTLTVDGGEPIDAASTLMIMTTGASQGASVVVTSDDEAAMQEIADLVAADLDADG